MSLNKLVGADCGGNNSLVQLSNILSRGSGPEQLPQTEQYIKEFLSQNGPATKTFNMKSLLNNMPNQVATLSNTSQIVHQPVSANSSRFIPFRPSTSFASAPLSSFYMQPQPIMRSQGPTNVQIEYVDEADIDSVDTNVKIKAQEYVEHMGDDNDQAYSEFMSFMKRISAGELNLNGTVETDQQASKDKIIEEMAEKYKDEWAKLSDVSDYWNSETSNGIPQEYNFTEGNVMLENKSALDIGKEKLKMGDIPGAALCFEAAVQQQPDSAEAWFLLGTTQAENEQDPLAICALKKSLDIDPRQLEAYITLAAAYTNENMPKFAMKSLVNWLKASPKYSDLLPQDVDYDKMDTKELQSNVISLYLRAAQMNPTQIDCDVQNALGVVFNISNEYEKAVDCFKTALMVASEDSKLWNRLGATLANSDHSAEAVEAYQRALELEPGFIRARYNVGITCMNLGAHKQAAEHFLVALNQQNKAKAMYPETNTAETSSSTIWTTLRMVCSFMGEYDVAKLVDDRNLEALNKFFDMDS